ncbi:DUF5947 family protein [Actinomycetospora cinnamomea]|uniref:Uncharacterized protein n=1 Tax=Actinomycetospora cinnamomea TaxID=663609 RepID=A0A2U1FI34_9PSEU|nr:DUF5947 family protein [Actinomycetospora cinnamomea]PVZ11835.1 hypothetical protein C8D89_103165 [Actinomycetospora cinnamomea]
MSTVGEVAGLRRFLAPREGRASAPAERCDLCAAEIPAEHPHLVHTGERSLRCACRACALLFSGRTDGVRTVPDRWLADSRFVLTDGQWDALQIPVGLAFFLESSATGGVVACYPGPAGATESELDLRAWADGVGAGRLAALLEPDVEALLVRRDAEPGAATSCLLVPIDACYRLVGLVRRHWRGFDGGAEAWQHVDAFFADARARAREVDP